MRGPGGGFLRTAVLLTLTAAPSCDSRDGMFDSRTPLVLELNLENAQGDPATRFADEERIRFVLEITNPTFQPVNLRFRSRKVFDFGVWDEDGLIVRKWSRNRLFADTFTVLEFKPGV